MEGTVNDPVITPYEIRLTVKSMEHQMVQVLSDYEGRIAKAIRLTAEKYLTEWDFEKEVEAVLFRTLRQTIEEAIRDKFSRRVHDEANQLAERYFSSLREAGKEK